MSSSGYLVPPSKDPSQETLWVETWKRIDRFLPDLRNDLAFEEAHKEPEKEPAPPAAEPETKAAPEVPQPGEEAEKLADA